jgi:NAD-dependent DNA ligase
LQQQAQDLERSKVELEEAMALAREVVTALEQQVNELTQEREQLANELDNLKQRLPEQIEATQKLETIPVETIPAQLESHVEQRNERQPERQSEPEPQPKPQSKSQSKPQPISEQPAQTAPVEKQSLEGKTFVITGRLKMSAEKLQALIQDAGGRINSMPSSKTSYIVVGENPGNKLQKAEKYGVPQLTETQLLELLNLQPDS